MKSEKLKISDIDISIKETELFVSIYVEGDANPFIETSYNSLKNLYRISFLELELLKCCHLQWRHPLSKILDSHPIEYLYSTSGDEWKIMWDGNWKDLVKVNKSKLLSFTQITNVSIDSQNSYVRLFTTANHTKFSITFDTIKSLVGINENNFPLLKGVFVFPVFYEKDKKPQDNEKKHIVISPRNEIANTLKIRFAGKLKDNYNWYCECEKNGNGQRLIGYRPDYRKYNGFNGYDDNTIDNAFNGDPDATWNVD